LLVVLCLVGSCSLHHGACMCNLHDGGPAAAVQARPPAPPGKPARRRTKTTTHNHAGDENSDYFHSIEERGGAEEGDMEMDNRVEVEVHSSGDVVNSREKEDDAQAQHQARRSAREDDHAQHEARRSAREDDHVQHQARRSAREDDHVQHQAKRSAREDDHVQHQAKRSAREEADGTNSKMSRRTSRSTKVKNKAKSHHVALEVDRVDRNASSISASSSSSSTAAESTAGTTAASTAAKETSSTSASESAAPSSTGIPFNLTNSSNGSTSNTSDVFWNQTTTTSTPAPGSAFSLITQYVLTYYEVIIFTFIVHIFTCWSLWKLWIVPTVPIESTESEKKDMAKLRASTVVSLISASKTRVSDQGRAGPFPLTVADWVKGLGLYDDPTNETRETQAPAIKKAGPRVVEPPSRESIGEGGDAEKVAH